MDQLYLPDQDQHDFQVELLKEFLLNDFFLNLTTFDQTTPEDIFPIEPINQDWRNIVRAKDISLEQQLNINIFKPHVKTHFMKEIESIIPPIESLNPEFEFDFVQDYINSLPMLSLDPFDTDTAIAPKSFINSLRVWLCLLWFQSSFKRNQNLHSTCSQSIFSLLL